MQTPTPAADADTTTPKRWSIGTLSYTSAGLIALFAWLLLGDFSWSMRDRSVGPLAQWYLKQLGVPNLLFALLIGSFPALIGLVLSPIISVKSDRHRGRMGRRIPFLLVTTPIAAFGMLGLGFTPHLSKWVHGHFPEQSEMVVAVVCFGVFWAAFEFATIAAASIFGGLINDVVPTALLGRFYGMFRAVSLLAGMFFNYWLIGTVETHYTVMLVVIGLFYCASFLWMCFKVKEGVLPPPPPKPPVTLSFIGEVKVYFRECFSRPYYVWVFVMITISGLAFMPVNTFTIPYANSLGMDMAAYGKCLTLTFAISLGLAYFLGWLSDLFHPLRVSIASLLGYAGVSLWAAFYARTPESFSVALVLHGVLSGCYYTSAASIGQRLYPHSRFAQFASAGGILGSIAGMILGPVVGEIIDLSGNAYHHTFTAGMILSVLALVSAWIVYGYFMRLGGTKAYVAP